MRDDERDDRLMYAFAAGVLVGFVSFVVGALLLHNLLHPFSWLN